MKRIAMLATLAVALAAGAGANSTATAQEPYVGEIRIYPYNFCPRGWSQANGQLIAISSNDVLFSLYGTTFGGDGRTSFGLPDLRGRAPMGIGQGPGLTRRMQGQILGVDTVTLTVDELPAHRHAIRGTSAPGNTGSMNNAGFADATGLIDTYLASGPLSVSTRSNAIADSGGNLAHENRQPSIALRYCIAMFGIYPSRN
jgi:microcystin-dependent protein